MMLLRDVMTTSVCSVHRATPLKDVARLLVERRISGVPVVADDGSVLGVVSEADFLLKEQGAEAIRHRPLARIFGERQSSRDQMAKLAALTAGEAMSSPAVTIGPEQTIRAAAELMTTRGINRLPVVHDSRLIGIVTRSDLVRAYVRSDDELAWTIREEVLLRTLWLDPTPFTVEVVDGVASISGRVERRSTAEMVERAIRMVPGIVAVSSDVAWSVDDNKFEAATISPPFPFSPR